MFSCKVSHFEEYQNEKTSLSQKWGDREDIWYPWSVALYRIDPEKWTATAPDEKELANQRAAAIMHYELRCTGSTISHRWIMTAQHCISKAWNEKYHKLDENYDYVQHIEAIYNSQVGNIFDNQQVPEQVKANPANYFLNQVTLMETRYRVQSSETEHQGTSLWNRLSRLHRPRRTPLTNQSDPGAGTTVEFNVSSPS